MFREPIATSLRVLVLFWFVVLGLFGPQGLAAAALRLSLPVVPVGEFFHTPPRLTTSLFEEAFWSILGGVSFIVGWENPGGSWQVFIEEGFTVGDCFHC